MIVVDTSALMAIIIGEPGADRCMNLLASETNILISAVTLAEAMIVSERKDLGSEMGQLIDSLSFTVIAADGARARAVAAVYGRWGKGVHPAKLNFVDCFSYDAARSNNCPLLYVGDDFARTDIVSALTLPR